jgi:ArsR family transcriptional regulator
MMIVANVFLSFCKNLSFLLNKTNYEKANYQDKYLTLNLVFKALNDPIRRKILKLLKKRGNMSAGEIANQFNITKPSISHHLDLLKQAGLAEVTRQGQYLYYSLNTTIVDELFHWTIKYLLENNSFL